MMITTEKFSTEHLTMVSTKEEVNTDGPMETDTLVTSDTAYQKVTERKFSPAEMFTKVTSEKEEWNHGEVSCTPQEECITENSAMAHSKEWDQSSGQMEPSSTVCSLMTKSTVMLPSGIQMAPCTKENG